MGASQALLSSLSTGGVGSAGFSSGQSTVRQGAGGGGGAAGMGLGLGSEEDGQGGALSAAGVLPSSLRRLLQCFGDAVASSNLLAAERARLWKMRDASQHPTVCMVLQLVLFILPRDPVVRSGLAALRAPAEASQWYSAARGLCNSVAEARIVGPASASSGSYAEAILRARKHVAAAEKAALTAWGKWARASASKAPSREEEAAGSGAGEGAAGAAGGSGSTSGNHLLSLATAVGRSGARGLAASAAAAITGNKSTSAVPQVVAASLRRSMDIGATLRRLQGEQQQLAVQGQLNMTSLLGTSSGSGMLAGDRGRDATPGGAGGAAPGSSRPQSPGFFSLPATAAPSTVGGAFALNNSTGSAAADAAVTAAVNSAFAGMSLHGGATVSGGVERTPASHAAAAAAASMPAAQAAAPPGAGPGTGVRAVASTAAALAQLGDAVLDVQDAFLAAAGPSASLESSAPSDYRSLYTLVNGKLQVPYPSSLHTTALAAMGISSSNNTAGGAASGRAGGRSGATGAAGGGAGGGLNFSQFVRLLAAAMEAAGMQGLPL